MASAISLIMLFAIGMAIESAQKSSTGLERKVIAQQDARGALEIMAMETRMVSYNPTFNLSANIWRNTNCAAPPATNPAYKGIQGATANSITLEMDIDGPGGDGNGNLTESNEIISYNYVSADPNRYITRETNCGGAQPFLGDSVASGNPRTVRVINAELGIPVFRYFNGQGAAIPVDGSANGIPAQTPNIRMIEITLAVETDEIDPSSGQRRRMIYSTREVLRNH